MAFPLFPLFFTVGQVLWYGFLALLAFFAVYSLILIFHWISYGMNLVVSLLAAIVYLSVSAALLLTMFFSIASFITT